MFGGKVNRNRNVAGAVSKQRQKERFKGVVVRRMEAFQPHFDEIYIRISNAAAMFKM